MKRLFLALFLVGCSEPKVCPEFYYGQKVVFKSGFYRMTRGTVVGANLYSPCYRGYAVEIGSSTGPVEVMVEDLQAVDSVLRH